MNGYGVRGNDILEYGNKPGVIAYETLVYATGPGYWRHMTNGSDPLQPYKNFTDDERVRPTYMHQAMIGLSDAVHSGEDVGVYGTGPGSELIQGVFEQNYVPYIISYAACIGPMRNRNPACKGTARKSAASLASSAISVLFITSIVSLLLA